MGEGDARRAPTARRLCRPRARETPRVSPTLRCAVDGVDGSGDGANLSDTELIVRAVVLGEQGRRTAPPNPWVGSVVVDEHGEIAGTGFHERPGAPHAEAVALAAAGDRARGGTAYATLEPCAHHGRTPPCA